MASALAVLFRPARIECYNPLAVYITLSTENPFIA
jgi:hypothetical protein